MSIRSFLSCLNCVQKEPMWSLILYVIIYVICMYVVCGIWKIDHCMYIDWYTPMGLGNNDPWVTHVTLTDVGSKVIYWSMTFGSSIWQKGYCIHMVWHIFMELEYNNPWVESHLWPQQNWGQRSSCGHWPFGWVFWKIVSVSTYFDVLAWELDTMILG